MGARLAPAERVQVRDEMAAHPVHVDELVHVDDLLVRGGLVVQGADVRAPAGGLVRNVEAPEDLVVEAFVALEELVHRPEVLTALGATDDPVVVGAGEGEDLAHREAGDGLRVRASYSAG